MARATVGQFTVWFDEPDAPAPTGEIGSTRPSIRVGVQPSDDALAVAVEFRRRDRIRQRLPLERASGSTEVAYFEGAFPEMRVGEEVEYTVLVRCGGSRFLAETRVGDLMRFRTSGNAGNLRSGLTVQERLSALPGLPAPSVAPSNFGTRATSPSLPAALTITSEELGVSPAVPGPRVPAAQVTDVSPDADLLGNVEALESVNPTTPLAAPPGSEAQTSRVEGRIVLDRGVPGADLTLRVYSRDFGGADTQLQEIKTDEQGYYVADYDPAGKPVNLEVRAVDPTGAEVALSETKFGAGKQEVLNLVAPAKVQPLAPEYQRLTADLAVQVGDVARLGQAREDAERPDISLLHATTGWDARLIGLAATAQRLTGQTGIPEDGLYAMFRAGLPTDPQQLAQVSADVIAKGLQKAKTAGVIDFDDSRMGELAASFKSFALVAQRETKAPGAVSTLGRLLETSSLSADQQVSFQTVFAAHRGPSDELWARAGEAGIPPEKIDALQLQGKLAHLTGNNAELTASLQAAVGSPDGLAKLVEFDLHRAEAWQGRLATLAGNDDTRLTALIPPGYAGDTPTAKRDAYAADLARKVRLAFPTRVVGRLLETGDLRLNGGHDPAKTAAFLATAEPLGFKLGQVPVDTFVAEHRDQLVAAGISDEQLPTTVAAAKSVQRLFQLTPSDGSMMALATTGLDSAYDIARIDYQDFYRRYGSLFPSEEEVKLVYRKAQQVSVVTYTFFSAAQQLNSAPTVFAISPAADARAETKTSLIKHYPTMDQLFGSLDFCDCEHCRSVLSPAAYFVDVLRLLDREPRDWQDFLSDWKTTHNGEDYTAKYQNPYEALIARRPDLPHIPLTCDNTLTALPYIDLVNEILEYVVANDQLDAAAAHDTGETSSAELLAEPQNVLIAAYDKLKSARYPLNLPFDLPLETVRAFFDYFETPLWTILDLFRSTEELFTPPSADVPYNRAAVYAEQLGFSPAEYALFVDEAPLDHWFELYGYTSAAEALGALPSAKTLARRLKVSYRELTDLVQTTFVNPKLDTLTLLRKLGIDAADVHRFKSAPGYTPFSPDEQTTFEQRLDDFSANYSGFDARASLEDIWATGALASTLLLSDPETGCSFDLTILRQANGDAANPIDFLKLNLFVRLWRRSGWTMAETDRALHTFLPAGSLPLTGTNLGAAMRSALLGLAHVSELESRLTAGRNGRAKLLTLWSPLPTTGVNPLYAQFFLTGAVHKNDPAFDSPIGDYLANPTARLADHLPAVQGALGLTANEIRAIVTEAGQDVATAPLTLATVSVIYRHALLAKGLHLPVRDLLALRSLSGVDPFAPLPSDPIAVAADDTPLTNTLHFVEIAEQIKASGFTVEQLDGLFRHRFDPNGPGRADIDAFLPLLITLAAKIGDIRRDDADPLDPAVFTDDQLQTAMALVLPSDIVQTFVGMWTGTIEYRAAKDGVAEADKLDPTAFAAQGRINLNYDADNSTQYLTHRGVLLDADETRLATDHPSPLLDTLLADIQSQAREFFTIHLQRLDPGDQTGFLDAADFDPLFAALPAIPDDLPEAEKQTRRQQNEQTERARRATLVRAFLPYLRQRLTRQLVAQTLATATGIDPTVVDALITDPTLLADPAAPTDRLLDRLAAAADSGADAAFFASPDLTGDQGPTATLRTVDSRPKPDGPLVQPAGTGSARFTGYLTVPATGTYRFAVACEKAETEVELRLDLVPNPVLRGTATADGGEVAGVVALSSGLTLRYVLEARALNGGAVTLLVGSDTLRKGPLNQLLLCPAGSAERVRRAWLLIAKTARLVAGFDFTAREIKHFLAHRGDFDGLDLGQLPTDRVDVATPATNALMRQFLRLADYAALRREAAGGSDDLITIFESARRSSSALLDPADPGTTLLTDLATRFAALTRRDPALVKDTAARLGYGASTSAVGLTEVPGYTQERDLLRLWRALQRLDRVGVSIDALYSWATPAPDGAVAASVRVATKARYEPDAWRRVAQGIFDPLRQRQRDALAAYLLPKYGYERIEQLYENFLVDPGTEPIVQTSRLRLAISSVQLFVQRCLLNLEPSVHPSAIRADHWQWMKRYRVWEANRKIFLFPENWLEPEWRDDKTHLFRELEGTLLQGDVSNDLADDAFFVYLKKLEELAHLQIVTTYADKSVSDPSSKTLHVVGRTFTLPHKYFYRRFAHEAWTPWEPIAADIDGDHLAAAMWRGRLHLFWITFLPKPEPNAGTGSSPSDSTKFPELTLGVVAQRGGAIVKADRIVQLRLHWAEYFQGEWIASESTAFDPTEIVVPVTFDPRKSSVAVSLEFDHGEPRAVWIHLGSPVSRAFRVVSKHATPRVVGTSLSPTTPYSTTGIDATQLTGSAALTVTFNQKLVTPDGGKTTISTPSPQILAAGGTYRILPTANRVDLPNAEFGNLVSPFFYQDDDYAFFVEPTLVETTSEEWRDWVHTPAKPPQVWDADDWWTKIPVQYEVPDVPSPVDPIDPYAKYTVAPETDWLTTPGTLIKFDDQYLSRHGGIDLATLPAAGVVKGTPSGTTAVNPGSALETASTLVAAQAITGPEKRVFAAGGLNLVAGAGLNAAILDNVEASRALAAVDTVGGQRFAGGFLAR